MFQNVTFPSLKACLELIKAFNRGLVPSSYSTLQQPSLLSKSERFRFASGVSQKGILSTAVVDCINQVQNQLGPGVHPDFCQLLVTTEPYGEYLSLAPRYVEEVFGSYGLQPPALIGGGVQDIMGLESLEAPKTLLGSHFRMRPSHGVSLMAAVLPGVELHPFHSQTSALPNLPWERLMRLARPELSHSAALFMLSEPHFTQVDELLGRLHNVLPGVPTVGGVLKSHAWGVRSPGGSQTSMRGAAFLGSETLDSGAVGCLMTGPLQGCRPVGSKFRVTHVTMNGPNAHILRLDDQPAFEALSEVQKHGLESREQLLRMTIGVDVEASGRAFVQHQPRAVTGGAIEMGQTEIRVGSLVQLFVQDPLWAQLQMTEQLKSYAGRHAVEAGSAAVKGRMEEGGAAFLYSCSGVGHDEISKLNALNEQLGTKLTIQGAKVEGEIGRIPWGEHWVMADQDPPLRQTFSSSFGFLQQSVCPTSP